MKPYKRYIENLELLRNATNKETVIELLDDIKTYIADARNEDWDTATRRAAIDAIDKILYNKIKTISVAEKQEIEEWL